MTTERLPTVVHAALGIVLDKEQRVLISKRPAHKLGGGYWEFPGGKIEAQESPEEALIRELKEEVNLEILTLNKLTQYRYAYPEYDVLLEVFIVESYEGFAIGLEDQEIQWVAIEELANYSFLEANIKVIELFRRCERNNLEKR